MSARQSQRNGNQDSRRWIIACAIGVLIGAAGTIWFGGFPLWADILIVVGAAVFVSFWIWLIVRASQPLPPLNWAPHPAVVIGYADTGDSKLVEVEFDVADEKHQACIADVVADESWDRFTIGSTWQVYSFATENGRVLLAETHDDIIRGGYNLDGVRLGGEHGPTRIRRGSHLLTWTFANDDTRPTTSPQ